MLAGGAGGLLDLSIRWSWPFVQTKGFLTGKHRHWRVVDVMGGGCNAPRGDRVHILAGALGAGWIPRRHNPSPGEQAFAFAGNGQVHASIVSVVRGLGHTLGESIERIR